MTRSLDVDQIKLILVCMFGAIGRGQVIYSDDICEILPYVGLTPDIYLSELDSHRLQVTSPAPLPHKSDHPLTVADKSFAQGFSGKPRSTCYKNPVQISTLR